MKEILCEKKFADKGTILRYSASAPIRFQEDSGTALLDCWTFSHLCELAKIDKEKSKAFIEGQNTAIHCGGWQSWSAGWELVGKETLPQKVRIIPELIKLTERPKDDIWLRGGKDLLMGHFIMYIRCDNIYLCVAAKDSFSDLRLPPVSYRISRKVKDIVPEIFCCGKTWKQNDVLAEIVVFHAEGYFNFKDALKKIYCQEEVFKSNSFLGDIPGGYESWYNHYTDINEKLILEDLDALGKTENLIKLWYIDRNKPVIFQIDDGWQKAVGEWEINPERFPSGLKAIAEKIEKAGCIPGLWLAPFLVTKSSAIFREKPEWLLREIPNGNPVVAGFNHLWDKQYYCLDISRKDVLEYLAKLMNRVINEWGFRYIKIDFLYAGFLHGAFSEGGSAYEHYEKAVGVLTDCKKSVRNLPVTYLGCGAPLGSSFRHFPLSRIGADTREEWDWTLVKLLNHVGRPSAYVSLMDTIGRAFLDGTVYINDPDVIFIRNKNCKLSENEKELIALVNFLLGGQIMFSDNPVNIEPSEENLAKRIVRLYDLLADDEYGAVRIDKDVFSLESRSGTVAGIINLRGKAYKLNPDKSPKLHEALGKTETEGFLTDHRIGGGMRFEPHTITVIKHPIYLKNNLP